MEGHENEQCRKNGDGMGWGGREGGVCVCLWRQDGVGWVEKEVCVGLWKCDGVGVGEGGVCVPMEMG